VKGGDASSRTISSRQEITMRIPRPFRALLSFGALTAALSLAEPASLGAQQYSGTFTVPNEVGGVMVFVLRDAGNGRITGSLASNGMKYQLEGRTEDGMMVGQLSGQEGTLFVEAERWESELLVMLYGTDDQGQPNYDDYSEISFTLATAEASGRGRSPLADTSPYPASNPDSDPYVGTFSDGSVTLQLQGGGGQYRGQVTVQGVSYPVQVQSGAQGVQGVIQAPDGQYQIVARAQGGGLFVMSGGAQYDLQRQSGAFTTGGARSSGGSAGGARAGGATVAERPPGGRRTEGGGRPAGGGRAAGGGLTSTGRELAPGFTEDHPQVREWVAFLAGKKLTRMSSYSSGTAGGYSARTDLYLCSDRSFALRDESMVAVDVGGAFGNSGGVDSSQGQWYVITNGQAVGLILEASNGAVTEFRMEYQNQETYANGERAYVTPAEVCR
jgi:hypothetical protein